MNSKSVQIEESWKKVLSAEFEAQYFDTLRKKLKSDKQDGHIIYPPGRQIFNAFSLTPFEKVKVVIIGQDPYHNPNEAMGLCFSVPKGKRVPPSLRNIYKEINNDIGIDIPNHGDLTEWAQQGVLLLNSVLTVQHKSPGSHRKYGWQHFTDAVIKCISDQKKGIVFILWGNYAKSKKSLIDLDKHHILESTHPSPLAGKAFFGNHHFSKTNTILEEQKKQTINWQISL